MRTKFHIIIGEESHEVSPTDIKNWDEVKFTLERKDFSGVMRSFSSDFEFVGDAFILLRDLYLADGFLASAKVAVSTKNNDWTYTEQFRCPLDFSTIEIENGVLSIKSIDNTLASMLKSKKSQKYEFPVSDFETVDVLLHRIQLRNNAFFVFDFSNVAQPLDQVNLTYRQSQSTVISEEYLSMCDQVNTIHIGEKSVNRFFATCNKFGVSLTCNVKGVVRCHLAPMHFGLGIADTTPIQRMELVVLTVDSEDHNVENVENVMFNDDILHKTINGVQYNLLINGTFSRRFNSVTDMENYIESNHIALYDGMFGIVGSGEYGYAQYWSNNIYEYQDGRWLAKGTAGNYYQDRTIAANYTIVASDTRHVIHLPQDAHVELRVASTNGTAGKMMFMYGSMETIWSDPMEDNFYARGITPQQLVSRIVQSITGEPTEVTIDEDGDGLLAQTLLVAGEELRQISDAKVYSTFGNFVDWMEAVFGYTYRAVGDELQFVHRSEVFIDEVAKTIDNCRDVKFSIVDDLIYASVEAGYAKKEYGEIDGRLETNFTNYYTTGYSLTDKKLTLQSKYRADSYGIEFTARKRNAETKDDKADEDLFFIRYVESVTTGEPVYRPEYQQVYVPSVCVANNEGFIAVMGGGRAVTLTMTSSDGNNALVDVEIEAGTALFTAGELEFTTDDMVLPEDWDGLVQLDHDGYRFRGYISKAEAAYGHTDGIEYTLIVKDITEL